MCINYTPFAHLTDDELIQEVCHKENPTDLELEMMHRLEQAKDERSDMTEEIRSLFDSCRETVRQSRLLREKSQAQSQSQFMFQGGLLG